MSSETYCHRFALPLSVLNSLPIYIFVFLLVLVWYCWPLSFFERPSGANHESSVHLFLLYSGNILFYPSVWLKIDLQFANNFWRWNFSKFRNPLRWCKFCICLSWQIQKTCVSELDNLLLGPEFFRLRDGIIASSNSNMIGNWFNSIWWVEKPHQNQYCPDRCLLTWQLDWILILYWPWTIGYWWGSTWELERRPQTDAWLVWSGLYLGDPAPIQVDEPFCFGCSNQAGWTLFSENSNFSTKTKQTQFSVVICSEYRMVQQ